MLVLQRSIGEVIAIGGGFKAGGVDVRVVEVRGDRVRLGFDAPPETTVNRQEIEEVIRRENREAAKVVTEGSPGAI